MTHRVAHVGRPHNFRVLAHSVERIAEDEGEVVGRGGGIADVIRRDDEEELEVESVVVEE